MKRRYEKQNSFLMELEQLSPAERSRRLAQVQGFITDAEVDEDDLDDEARDVLADECTTAMELDQLRTEVAALRDLTERTRRVKEHAQDSKLAAEDIVIEYETCHGRECERVGHLMIGFDIRSLAPADPQTGE